MSEPWIRRFVIDAEERTDTTYRTPIIEHFTPVRGRKFLDLGACDGYESRALALRGAAQAVAVEAKQAHYELAVAAKEHLGLENHDVLKLDVRRIDEHGLGTFDVVLCFGLLYHMTNPFNVLRRIRNVTGSLLLVETHVAPAVLAGLRPDLAPLLPVRTHAVELDGVRFDGKLVPHVGEKSRTKGGLDNEWGIWLTPASLVEAVTHAGFRIEGFYTQPADSWPESARVSAARVGLDRRNSRVWLVAKPAGEAAPVPEAVERVLGPLPVPSLAAEIAERVRLRTPVRLKVLLPLPLRRAVAARIASLRSS